ncbi:phenylacetic acid degradation operon negative regulatory protein [Kineosphaera limosa]|uniref:Putative PaaX family transcriptional regulator n=1 Tax=Kineosphaera limosa NBRC 100340 TaxID=1184609 RepID=K6XB13_9MICO|nr:PaaX family transcriptional regulator C-terminal domain-containing protein [Kineosphaera limosa]NYE02461.1 phenylacetic acid degradation operon negative regulatory protein [Kineosphaera limosa]GAB96014.1 putative PaaX family transcriptional regulator [Kineosphaera limosa NBRC 100340]
MRARSALFDLYGDHVARRGGWAPVGGLVRALEALDIAGPATRTAVSRMVREGWLTPSVHEGARGYAQTARATRQLADARRRIYDEAEPAWSGAWDVVVLEPPEGRAARERVAGGLRYLGYAPLAGSTWVGARRHPDLAARLEREDVDWRGFASRFDGDDHALATDLWDLPALARGYLQFDDELTTDHEPSAEAWIAKEGPAAAFARRARLVHRWRLFLFDDPGLPAQVLPQDWPRPAVAARFRDLATRLAPAADTYVDACLRS